MTYLSKHDFAVDLPINYYYFEVIILNLVIGT